MAQDKPLDLLVKHTGRGFEIIKFKDCYGAECSLQQSSLALYDTPGTSAVWLGIDTPKDGMGRMHLTVEQVKSLLPVLKRWANTGSLSEASGSVADADWRDHNGGKDGPAEESGVRNPG